MTRIITNLTLIDELECPHCKKHGLYTVRDIVVPNRCYIELQFISVKYDRDIICQHCNTAYIAIIKEKYENNK
jgi:hypothetical protein